MRLLFCALTLIFVTIGCKKENVSLRDGERRLPNATEKGRGIFGCYINDETYSIKRHSAITYIPETGYLFIENRNESFEFRLFVYEGVLGEGAYSFSNTGEEWISSDYSSFYGVKEDGLNVLEITRLDYPNHVVSGRFEIDLIDIEGNIKRVRNGRFDLEI